MEELYSVKMRASKTIGTLEKHISGAERIVLESEIETCANQLIRRGLTHDLGKADFINLKCQKVCKDKILYLDALPVTDIEVENENEGWQVLSKMLERSGIKDTKKILNLLPETKHMRGAMLLDVDSFKRLEKDLDRGIRVTNMDQEIGENRPCSTKKNHYEEALVLATKVANCKGILGEICISDDPNYVTGYFASKELGYVRISKLKKMGSDFGGRIFLFRGNEEEKDKAISFLQETYVMVRNIKPLQIPDRENKWDFIKKELTGLSQNNLYRTLKTFDSAQGSHVTYHGRDVVLMASNSYLDLTAHEAIKDYTKKIIDTYGFGSGGSRLTTGNTDIHDLLEKKIADFKGCEASLVFSTGYVANLATISCLMTKGDVIFSDELNHASIIDGCRLSGARIVVYKHNDMNDLLEKIQSTPFDRALAVSDAVFSMDGDILALKEFVEICEKYNVFSMVDEAHATGVIGKTGRGIEEHFDYVVKPDITMGTLSKAIGGEGGFVTGRRDLIEYLKNKARGFIFSTSLSQPSMACAIAGLSIIENEPERVKALHENVAYFCQCMKKYGMKINAKTPIIPIMVGDEKKAVKLSEYLLENGFYISAIRYPTVKKGSARLRVAIMATHTKEELKQAAKLICGYLK